MATVAELESRLNEVLSRLDETERKIVELEEENELLRDAVDNDSSTAPVRGESSVNYERDEDGKITDHDGELAPTVDSTGTMVHDPNA